MQRNPIPGLGARRRWLPLALLIVALPLASQLVTTVPPGHNAVATLFGEAAAVARAKGVRIADDLDKRLLKAATGLPAAMKASMLQDLERGNRLELDYLSGAVVRLGEEVGVDTPAHRTAWQALHLYAGGS